MSAQRTWLFRAKVFAVAWQVEHDRPDTQVWIVAKGATRSQAVTRAMRQLFALHHTSRRLHDVRLEEHGEVEVAC